MPKGEIDIITGTMSSGKTEELLRRLGRAKIARQKVQVFYPDTDTRSESNTVSSASGGKHFAMPFPANNPEKILEMADSDTHVFGIDEAQFASEELVEVCKELMGKGAKVYVSGLDMNFRGEPFGSTMERIMQVSFDVQKLHAVCMMCGDDASVPQRLVLNSNDRYVPAPIDSDLVAVGRVVSENGNSVKTKEHVIYQARCWNCLQLPETLDES